MTKNVYFLVLAGTTDQPAEPLTGVSTRVCESVVPIGFPIIQYDYDYDYVYVHETGICRVLIPRVGNTIYVLHHVKKVTSV